MERTLDGSCVERGITRERERERERVALLELAAQRKLNKYSSLFNLTVITVATKK